MESMKKGEVVMSNSLERDQQEMVERQRQIATRTPEVRNENSRITEPILRETERWVSAGYIARKYSVSYSTARRMIMSILGDDTRIDRRMKGRKPKKQLRRLPLSKLAELEDSING
jgi:ribosomal protein S25